MQEAKFVFVGAMDKRLEISFKPSSSAKQPRSECSFQAMYGEMIFRSKASLIHGDGSGCSFSGRQMPSSERVHKFARTGPHRLAVSSEYQGGRYQGEQSRSSATTQQQRRPQTEYDYDFPPPPGVSS